MIVYFSSGRVLNRFSKDIGFMDDILPYVFCEYLIVSVACKVLFISFVSIDIIKSCDLLVFYILDFIYKYTGRT